MADLNEVHEWLRKHKKELKELQGILEDELSQDDEYRRIVGELDMLREKKRSMEIAAASDMPSVSERVCCVSSICCGVGSFASGCDR